VTMAQSSVETYPVMSIAEHFGRLTDPRMEERVEHRLLDIIVIAICGVICGADSWVEIEEFGKAKQDWLKGFVDLPNSIPSHDTFGRVFGYLSAFQFQACFMSWIEAVFRATDGQGVAIDGKRLRGSYDRSSDQAAIHRVSAWACANRLVLGQVKTQEKSNEISAIPELLKLLELKGCIVTIDAMGCQKGIAAQIIDQGGDYVLALKGNQGQLHEDVWCSSLSRLRPKASRTTHTASMRLWMPTMDGSRSGVTGPWIGSMGWRIRPNGKGSTSLEWSNRSAIPGGRSRGRDAPTSPVWTIKRRVLPRRYGGHWGIENSLHWSL